MKKGLQVSLPIFGKGKNLRNTNSKFGIRGNPLRTLALGAMLGLTLIVYATIVPLARISENTEATAGDATLASTSITLTSDSLVAGVELTPSGASENGTFAKSSDATAASFNVSTTNYSGYELTISSANTTSSTNLTNAGGATFASISGALSEAAFSADSTAGAGYNGKWGYTFYADGGSGTTFYPATTSSTIGTTTAANGSTSHSATSDKYFVGIGARAASSQAAGTYSSKTTASGNTYTVYAVGNPITYSIFYKDNTNDSSVSGLPGNGTTAGTSGSTSSASQTTITLSTATPTRTGYTFGGWCKVAPTVNSNGSTTCAAANTLAAGASFGIDQTTTNINTNLYAIWNIKTNLSLTINFAGSGISGVQVREGSATGTLKGTVSSNGGSVSGLTYNTAYYLVPTYTNSYYEFASWAKNSGTVGSLSSTSTANPTYTIGDGTNGATVTGRGKAYSLALDKQGATSNGTAGPIYYRYGTASFYSNSGMTTALNSISVPAKTGYTFGGYFSATSGGTQYITAAGAYTNNPQNLAGGTLYARWTANNYDIKITRGDANVTAPTVKNSSGGTVSGSVNGLSTTYSLTYGQTYTISWGFGSGYELESVSRTDGTGTFTQTTNSTTSGSFTVGAGTATITIKAKSSVKYMQNYTKATCQSEASSANVSVVDRRDGNAYNVRYINGNCWMVQNLRITASSGQSAGTILATDSNFSSNMTMTNGTSFNSYTVAQYYNSGDTNKGVWYSFCAAGAKTSNACNNSGSYSGSSDICPAGWRLPTNSEFSGITSYASAFQGVTGGLYYGGSLVNTGYGYWWSSTANNNNNQYTLYYNGSSLSTSYYNKYYGFYVRCIRAS